MASFLIDEDLPRSLARSLRSAGLTALDVRDVGLRGKHDDDIFAYAVSHHLSLISSDLRFGNLQRFPLGAHAGIIIARFPNEVSTATLNEAILGALRDLSAEEITGNLIVIEPGKVRLRRAGSARKED